MQGTLDMLILKSLSLVPMHGFGITQRIEQISRGVFRVNPGSLLLAFQRMERDGLIDAEWRQSENNRRARYYAITAREINVRHSTSFRAGHGCKSRPRARSCHSAADAGMRGTASDARAGKR